MRHVRLRRPIAGLWLLGLGAVVAAVGDIRLGLFAATVAVEIAALALVLRGRGHLQPTDEARWTWTLVAAALGTRLLAELRVGLLYLDAVPGFIADSEPLRVVYLLVLRYLFTASDLLLLVALWTARRSFERSGLGYPLRPRDLGVLVLLAPLPVLTWAAQAALQLSPSDPGISTFRVISVVVGAVVSAMGLGLVSLTLQMGGGVLAWIWGSLAVAGIARVFAFVAASGLQALGVASAMVVEQSLLWTFACAWLLAAGLHWRLVRA
jgi:hypothetical protein